MPPGAAPSNGAPVSSAARSLTAEHCLQVYRALCPLDRVESGDERIDLIVSEMRSVAGAATLDEAVAAIAWWDAWPNPTFASAREFARSARARLRAVRARGGQAS